MSEHYATAMIDGTVTASAIACRCGAIITAEWFPKAVRAFEEHVRTARDEQIDPEELR